MKIPHLSRPTQVITLTVLLVLTWAMAAFVSGIEAAVEDQPAQSAAAQVGLPLLSAFWIAAATAFLILRSRLNGFRLVLSMALAFYCTHTLITQVESFVFLPSRIPPGVLPRIVLMGTVVAAVFTPAAVLILGKMKSDGAVSRHWSQSIPVLEWAWKLAAIAIAYPVLYFVFGYFVAFRQPAIQHYYQATDPGSFFMQLAVIWRDTPWLFGLAILRALFWTACVYPVVRSLRGSPADSAFALAFFFSTQSAQLLHSNPFMPEAVRLIHLVETLPSNVLFGLLVGWLLTRRFSRKPERKKVFARAA